MDNEKSSAVVLADIYDPHIADVEAYLNEVRILDDVLKKAAPPLRDVMVKERYIRNHVSVTDGSPLASVDSSSVDLSSGETCTVIALAIRYSESERVKHVSARKTGQNTEGFRHMANALRLRVEVELLASSESLTIADHSFWSLLMEANKAITSFQNLTSDQGKDDLEDIYNECFGDGKLFMRAMRNQNVVAISKISATMVITSEKSSYSHYFDGQRISDRAIFSLILKEGEYTRPDVIGQMTEATFGIERHGFTKDEQAEIHAKFKDRSGLMVFYYRPWPHQPAYRIEFHRKRFPNDSDLAELMDTIRRETSNPMMREPVPQFMADRICQQVHSIAMLYGEAHRIRFPHLLFANRTSEI